MSSTATTLTAFAQSDTQLALAELIERCAQLDYSDTYSHGLTPAQWSALRYFSRANRFSNTLSAYANFQATTKGTASTIVKGLLQKGFLTRTQSVHDRRAFPITVTKAGRNKLEDDPIRDLTESLQELTESEQHQIGNILSKVLVDMLQRRQGTWFGVCITCGFLCIRGMSEDPAGPHECGFRGEPLRENELDQICFYHSGSSS